MKKLFALMLVVILTFSLVACGGESETTTDGGKNEAAIVGKWESVDMEGVFYNFEKDGKGSYEYMGTTMEFTYTDDGKAIAITYTNATNPNTYEYTIDGNKLNIKDDLGNTVVYEKK